MNVEFLYRKYGPMVLRRCRRLLRDEDLALDAMQDVFVRVLQRRGRLKATYPSARFGNKSRALDAGRPRVSGLFLRTG